MHPETRTRLRVSVVIPSYRRLDQLPRLLGRYSELGADEIVVILDGPHTGSEALAEAWASDRIRIVELAENIGLALARIEGLNQATGDIILIVDDDVLPVSNIVAQHREKHQSGPFGLVQIGYMPVALPRKRRRDQAPTYLYAREYEAATRTWESQPEKLLSGLWNGNVSLRRELYQNAERARASIRLDYNEDLDLGLRLDALDSVADFDRTIVARHLHSRTFDAFVRESRARGEAVVEIESRWGKAPPQLLDLVRPAAGGASLLTLMLSRIPPRPVIVISRFAYHCAGAVHAWGAQDLVCRLLRRVLAQRAYRRRLADLAST